MKDTPQKVSSFDGLLEELFAVFFMAQLRNGESVYTPDTTRIEGYYNYVTVK